MQIWGVEHVCNGRLDAKIKSLVPGFDLKEKRPILEIVFPEKACAMSETVWNWLKTPKREDDEPHPEESVWTKKAKAIMKNGRLDRGTTTPKSTWLEFCF